MEGQTTTSVSNLDDEVLDPRVQIELENLNVATDEINRLESTLEEANSAFRSSLNDTSVQLQSLAKKLGSCVEKARPYYEAKEKAKKLQMDCQRAAVQYQRANAVHQAARETIALAEERFTNLKESGNERKFDSAWQEMLNHATMKIMEAEAQKSASERDHQKRAAAYTTAEIEVQELSRKLKTAINKSRPYFNHRSATQIKLEAQKDRIYKLQKDIMVAKNKYSLTLRNLEQISEEIHELRRINMKREPGVGAEMDQCEAFIEKTQSRESFLDSTIDEDQEYWKSLKEKLVEISEDYFSDEKGKLNSSVLLHKDTLSSPYENFSPKQPEKKEPNETSMGEYTSSNGMEGRVGEWVEEINVGECEKDKTETYKGKENSGAYVDQEENFSEEISVSDIIIEEKEDNFLSNERLEPSGQSSGSLVLEGNEYNSVDMVSESCKPNFVLDEVRKIEAKVNNNEGNQIINEKESSYTNEESL